MIFPGNGNSYIGKTTLLYWDAPWEYALAVLFTFCLHNRIFLLLYVDWFSLVVCLRIVNLDCYDWWCSNKNIIHGGNLPLWFPPVPRWFEIQYEYNRFMPWHIIGRLTQCDLNTGIYMYQRRLTWLWAGSVLMTKLCMWNLSSSDTFG